MTKLITRYFDSAEKARKARHELLYRRGVSPQIVRLFEDADGLAVRLTGLQVAKKTADTYQKHVAGGGAVLMVAAGYKPLGVAGIVREVTADMGAVDLGDLVQEVEVEDVRPPTLSVLRGHPLMMTRPRDPYATNFYMANWPIPLISRRKPFKEMLFEPHARMADFILPLTNRRKPYTESSIPRHGRMANFPIPLISRRKPNTNSIIPRHGRMANFPIPLINRRKPYTGSLIGRHTRMANWPFPHLINGKSTNSLMPNGPRMANFPISLLSDRKPNTASIIPRHGRMANFILPLISKRKPNTASAIPKHGRMADMFLPLVIKSGDAASPGRESGFSFSKTFGMPTLIRR
jgi:hypothetical protein